jgi:HK97 family phage major capsid protein
MTAPTQQSATTAGFKGYFTPAQVAAIMNTLVDQAPFAASLTRAQSATGRMAFPIAGPTGFAWLGENTALPVVALNDDAVLSVVCKLAGLLKISNELVIDSTTNLTQALGTLLRDSLSAQLDSGLLLGTGAANNQPDGIIAKATAVTGTSLLDATSKAVGAIGDSGGSADTIALSATTIATENARLASTGGSLLYPQGFGAAVGLKVVAVPGMVDRLVYDSSRVFLVLGQDSTAEFSNDYFFGDDAVAIRVKARINAAAPVPAKSIRKLTGFTVLAEEAQPTKTTGTRK